MSIPREAGLTTPALVVDRDVLDRNVAAMAGAVRDRGLALRPHVKTHKCPQIAHRQRRAGAVGITVATVAEAEVFVASGFTDVFIAYPVWVDAARGVRLRALADRAALRIGVDSVEAATAVARHTTGACRAVEVLVEVDSGHHRTGVAPPEAGRVAVGAQRAGLPVRGVFTFPGHGYGPGRQAAAAADEAAALRRAAASLRTAGIPAEVISGGSTPTAAFADADVLTELRPGVYVFGDAQQVALGAAELGQVGLTVVTTVVSRGEARVVCDAGSKVLGADRPVWATGFGRLPDHPDAQVGALSEHHATVSFPAGASVPALGSVLRVVPNHVCAAVNLADELVVVAGGRIVDRWPVAARGANA